MTLCTTHCEEMCKDILQRYWNNMKDNDAVIYDDVYNNTLCAIEDSVCLVGGQNLSNYGHPAPNRQIN